MKRKTFIFILSLSFSMVFGKDRFFLEAQQDQPDQFAHRLAVSYCIEYETESKARSAIDKLDATGKQKADIYLVTLDKAGHKTKVKVKDKTK